MEVLITMIITLVGLLGIVALQSKAQLAEMESYQRAQALIIMSDIVDRVNANRLTTSCFAFTDPSASTPFIGADGTGELSSPTCTASTTAYNDQAIDTLEEINDFLEGTSETLNGNSVGSILGARACISYDSSSEIGSPAVSGTGLYSVVVSWQAMDSLIAPTVNCANGLYGTEAQRRAVSTTFRVADLF